MNDVCANPECGHAKGSHCESRTITRSWCRETGCGCVVYLPPGPYDNRCSICGLEVEDDHECPPGFLTAVPPEADACQSEDFADELPAHIAESMKDPEYAAASADVKRRFDLMDTLIRLRHDLGLTQGEVATRMGVKQPTVSGFENEGSDPRLSTIQRYARAVESEVTLAAAPSRAQLTANAERAWEKWADERAAGTGNTVYIRHRDGTMFHAGWLAGYVTAALAGQEEEK